MNKMLLNATLVHWEINLQKKIAKIGEKLQEKCTI